MHNCLKINVIAAVLVVSLSPIAQAETGYWFGRADMPSRRQELIPALLDGKIYVIGGLSQTAALTDIVEIFDPTTNSWSTGPSYPAPIHHCATAVVDGILYGIGGYITSSLPWIANASVFAFDPTNQEWRPRASMMMPRGEHIAVPFDGKIYVFGGNDPSGNDLVFTEVYDPALNSWSLAANMPTPRHHPAGAAIDSLIYVVGGRQGYWGQGLTVLGVNEAYAPESDTWYTLDSMPTARSVHSVASMNGKLYAFGGEWPDVYNEVEEYDPVSGNWRQLNSMHTPRHGTDAVVVGDTIFVIAGSTALGVGADNSTEGFLLGTCVDSDFDGYGDTNFPANRCPLDICENIYNPEQIDSDSDGIGDLCDNCPDTFNPDQSDLDTNGIGDLCESCCHGTAGNVNYDESDNVDISDLTLIVNHLFVTFETLPCAAEANTSGDEGCSIDFSDLTSLFNHLFVTFDEPPACS
ncbi:MAG: kelch repeat-containing protein, partial [candidate division Zixibacteria bacterium]